MAKKEGALGMIPVRCFTCGKVISSVWEEYKERVRNKGEQPKDVLDELGIKRYCCRRMLLTHVEIIDILGKYR
jgi:DNA-directed RNA polymerase subunit N